MKDISILDEIIIGRVEPHIYAFTTETYPNYLKVGDTYRPVGIRLQEWRRYFPDLQFQVNKVAKVDEDTYFRDHAVHHYLETLGKKRLEPLEAKKLKSHYSREFFKDTDNKHVEEAIKDIQESHEQNSGKYAFYAFQDSRIPIEHTYKRTEKYEPRPNQAETIHRFKNALKAGRTNLLMYAVMRFGKSFTSMCCAVEMKADLVLIVSAKADVKQEWKKTVESHVKFADYCFMDSSVLLEREDVLKETLRKGKAVVFLTLQDLMGEEIKRKHREIFEEEIDLLLIDETHYGARAKEYGRVLNLSPSALKRELKEADSADHYEESQELKQLRAKVRVHLSGTPYRILMGSEFEEEDIIAFYQSTDIVQEQEKWDKEHLLDDNTKEWDNPYYGFPQMIRFAFLPNQASIDKMEALKKEGASFALSELFKPHSISKNREGLHKQFIHEEEVLGLLQAIDGSKEDDNILPFLDVEQIRKGEMCRHMVFVLPYRASCDAMETLLNKRKGDFRHLNEYKVINIAGVHNERIYKSTSDVKAKIKKCEQEGEKTITLTVNRMLTGSTVKEWDTMVFLKECASPQEYDQAIFRLQNQYIRTLSDEHGDVIRYNMKPQTLLVDFDPNRMFVLQEQKSQIYNVNAEEHGNSRLEERVAEELRVSPIITVKESGLQKVSATDIMDAVRRYSNERSVLDEANDIPIDRLLLDIEQVRQAIAHLSPIDSRKGLDIRPVEGEEIDLPIEFDELKIQEIPEKEKSSGDALLLEEANENLDKKLATFYAQILFFALLTESNVKSLEEVIAAISYSDENKRIAQNVGLLEDMLRIIQEKSNPFILSALDYKIQNVNSLVRDESLTPEERVEVAMTKFGRLSSSEIVTPQPIAREMIDALPNGAVTSTSKVLDIASKQGEFVRALYAKYGANVGRKVYSIPTSTISYEFTRKVYRLLELPEENVFSDFTSYDLINNDINTEIMKQLKSMNFDVAIGNPPYHKTVKDTSDIPVYHEFIDLSSILSQKISLVTPARYLFNAGKTPKAWNKKVLNDEHIKVLLYNSNSSAIFPNVDIKGGIAVLYRDQKKVFGKIGHFSAFPQLNSIYTKTRGAEQFRSITEIFYPQTKFILDNLYSKMPHLREKIGSSGLERRLTSSIFNLSEIFSKQQQNPTQIQILGLQNGNREYRWIDKIFVEQGDNLDKYKVIIPKSNGTGALGEILSTPIVGGPLIGVTQTFIMFGAFDTSDEAEACLKYIKSKFVRTLLGILKVTQDNPRSTWRFVPLQNFTKESDIDWTKSVKEIDQQLYTKYNLSQEEIEFIERMIKPME